MLQATDLYIKITPVVAIGRYPHYFSGYLHFVSNSFVISSNHLVANNVFLELGGNPYRFLP